MANIVNHTPFAAALFSMVDPHGTPFEVAVLSASFESLPGQPLRVSEQQTPPREVDEYWGDPGTSSVRFESDLAYAKPKVDVLVSGAAVTRAGRRARKLKVTLRVAKLRKTLIVSGDRAFRVGPFATPARRFSRMPIVYERAFGGAIAKSLLLGRSRSHSRNPVGIGFHRAASADPEVASLAPNISSSSRVRRWLDRWSEPAGFAPIPRGWPARARFAGTYDDRWKEDQFPLLPLDFDPRYFQAAPRDQQLGASPEGESVELVNMTPEGRWAFRVPTLDVPIYFFHGNQLVQREFRVDTLLLLPDEHRFTLTARAAAPVRRNAPPLEEVVLGKMSQGWQRASASAKRFHDPTGSGGVRPDASYYSP